MFSLNVNERRSTKTSSGRAARGRLLVAFILVLAMAVAGGSVAGSSAVAKQGNAAAKAKKQAKKKHKKKKVRRLGAPGQTLKKSMWGPPVGPDGQSIFPTLKNLGVGLYSIQARWDQIAPLTRPLLPTDPNDPAYQWPQYLVDAVQNANAQGIEVQILIMGTPPWANGGKTWEWVPDDSQDYADFATAAARKFPTVDHWMIWGEPNRAPNFKPSTPATTGTGKLSSVQQVAPRNYAVLLEGAYQALKAENPNNKVIGGNTYTAAGNDDINTYQWAQNMKLPNGSRPHMDMWGHNPWGFKVPNFKDKPGRRGTVTFSDLKRLVKVLDKNFPGQKLKLFLAEWGVPSGFRDKDLGYKLSKKEANQWLNTAFKLTRSYKRIYTLGWVHLFDNPRNSTGLFTRAGKVKPIYKTYRKGRP